jgi:DNA-binding CsgD family transcriptional regulator
MDTRSTKTSRRRKARLVLAGHTYRSLARQLGVSEHTVKAAVRGVRDGEKARLVVRTIEGFRA